MIKKKIIKIILGSSTGLTIVGMIILIPVLMIYSFFGGKISSSGYVECNQEYSDEFLRVLNENIINNDNGYVPLERIVYFYFEDDSLSFSDIYLNNLDLEQKTIKPISNVCMESYSSFFVCKDLDLENDEGYSYKPFNAPIDFKKSRITSFFAEERVVYETFDIHYAWDFAANEKTPLYSVGDGVVTKIRFNQQTNEINKENGAGNYIEIEYEIEGEIYSVIYAHLYPGSSKVKVGDQVTYWQEIATVGTTGYSTGNHLHWEVTRKGEKIDGMNLIDFNLKNDVQKNK